MGAELHVFVVGNPFQFLVSLEAQAVYGGPGTRAYYVIDMPEVPSHDRARKQLRSLLDRFPQETVIWIKDNDRAAEVADRVRPPGTPKESVQVFLPTHQIPKHRELTRKISSLRPVLFDDGNATLLVSHTREQPHWRLTRRRNEQLGQTGRLRGRFPVPRLAHDVWRPRAREFRAVEFFSIYRVAGSRRDTWRANRLDLLRGMRSESETRTPVIVGCSLAENSIISMPAYDLLIDRAMESIPSRPLYFAHRFESPEKLERISSRHDIEIVRPDSGIELALLDNQIVPDPLHGVLSTALDTLPILYPGIRRELFSPPLGQVESSWLRRSARKQVSLMIKLQRRAQMNTLDAPVSN